MTKCTYYKVGVSTGKDKICVDKNESNAGDNMNWIQTVRPKFNREFCFDELGNGDYVKYLVSKSSCDNFSINDP